METAHDIPADLLKFLTLPESYGGKAPVEVIETHASLIFLAGDEAFKVYKHINLGYLDFSTPEKRKRVAEREFELNSPAAPAIYLGVTAISKTKNGYQFGADGGDIEYAVRMRRFPQAQLLSAVASRGELSPALIDDIAALVARLHNSAQIINGFDHAARITAIAEDVIGAFRAAPDLFDARSCDGWARDLRAAIQANENLLRERAGRGLVRRCHGDLHLRNLVLQDGAPTPFDALEFDEALATTDIFYDFAFLLMDLIHRGHGGDANALLNDYCARLDANALDGLAALPMWMSVRAAIRARVAADRAREAGAGPEFELAHDEARAYFDTARRLLTSDPPKLVAIGGFSGTGKTTLALRVAPLLARPVGALHLRSDVERKIMAGISPRDTLPKRSYTRQSALAVYNRLHEKARVALGAGFSVVVDAVQSNKRERDAIEAIGRDAGAQFIGLWLDAPVDLMKSRVRARTGDASDADETVIDRQMHSGPGAISWRRADASEFDAAALPDWLARELRDSGIEKTV